MNPIYVCPFCDATFRTASDYRNHIRDCEALDRKMQEETDRKQEIRKRIDNLKAENARLNEEIKRLENMFSNTIVDQQEEETDTDSDGDAAWFSIACVYDPDTNEYHITDIKEIDIDE